MAIQCKHGYSTYLVGRFYFELRFRSIRFRQPMVFPMITILFSRDNPTLVHLLTSLFLLLLFSSPVLADGLTNPPGLPTSRVAGSSPVPVLSMMESSETNSGFNQSFPRSKRVSDALGASETDPEPVLPWSVFGYGGKWSDNRFVQLLGGSSELRDSYIWVVGASRTLDRLYDPLILEAEANVGYHSGLQDHLEFNVSPNLRWTSFPWDPYVNTSLAYGLGLSYATEKPEVETLDDREASRFLFFMVGEVAFELTSSDTSDWEGFVRIHHRSGGFETVIDAEGSNFLSLGVRYRFGE